MAALASYIVFSQGYQSAYEDQATERQREQASDRARHICRRSVTVEAAIECYDKSYEATREEYRSEQDLNAQREMSDWTEGVLWTTLVVGLLTSALTALGVWWVKRTLDATLLAAKSARDAVDVTREIGEAQIRPYLATTKVIVVQRSDSLRAIVSLKNHGLSVARNVGLEVGFYPPAPDEPGVGYVPHLITAQGGTRLDIGPNESIEVIADWLVKSDGLGIEEMSRWASFADGVLFAETRVGWFSSHGKNYRTVSTHEKGVRSPNPPAGSTVTTMRLVSQKHQLYFWERNQEQE